MFAVVPVTPNGMMMFVTSAWVYRIGAGVPLTVTLVPPRVVVALAPEVRLGEVTAGRGPIVIPVNCTTSPGAIAGAGPVAALCTAEICACGAMLPNNPACAPLLTIPAVK